MSIPNNIRICIDTCPFIYLFEENVSYIDIVDEIFSKVQEGTIRGISSYITLLEVLVKPLQQGNMSLADVYKEYLVDSSMLELYRVDDKIAEQAAILKAKYSGNGFKIKTPDAIQIATAIVSKSDMFVTNDSKLKNVNEIDVAILEDLK